MNLAGWLYDHAPTPIKTWLDNREQNRMADRQYEEYHLGGAGEADSIFGDQRKAIIEKNAIYEIRTGYHAHSSSDRHLSISIGQSAAGFHYVVNHITQDGEWSKPLPTRDLAERVGLAMRNRETETVTTEHQHLRNMAAWREPTHTGEVALQLRISHADRDAYARTGNTNMKEYAKEHIQIARSLNQDNHVGLQNLTIDNKYEHSRSLASERER